MVAIVIATTGTRTSIGGVNGSAGTGIIIGTIMTAIMIETTTETDASGFL
jgi:hypothetical protein